MIRGALGVGIVLLGAATARADVPLDHGEGTRFHLAYEAPASCPDRAAFLAAIRVRTRRPHLAPEGEPALSFVVSVEPRQGTTVGRLEVREPVGPPQKRMVSSVTCAEVAKALALVVALILDPDAETAADPEPSPTEDEPAPTLEPLPLPNDAKATLPRRPRRERPPPGAVAPPHPVFLSVGGDLGVTSAIGPTLAPGAGAFVDVAFAPRSHRKITFSPSFRLGPAFAMTSSDLPVGSHRYWWAGAAARVCPIQLSLGRGARLAPCGGVQVGAYHGSTRDVPNGASSTDLWVAPTAGAAVEWSLTSSVGLELQGGAVFPLIRTRFFLAPDITIFDVPAVAGTGSIACRVRFW